MSTIVIRPLAETERDAFYHLAVVTFGGSENADQRAQGWRRSVENSPEYDPIQVRGAWRRGPGSDEQFLGGYIDYERTLAIGPARLPVGCIGAVVTHPDHRLQGVASALLNDAINLAQERRHALLLLDGIPNFYHRFGFAGVLSETGHAMKVADIQALPPSPYSVREATLADAGALLQLYHQEFDPFAGVFARTSAIQQYQLAFRLSANPPLLAVDAAGEVKGYLLLPWAPAEPISYEVAASDWDAASALLQHQTTLLAANEPAPPTLTWQMPPGSATFFALADHIRLESTTYHLPAGDWMARIGHLPTFLHAILPHWRQRRQQSSRLWSGQLRFDLDQTPFCLAFDGSDIHLIEHPCSDPAEGSLIRLTPQALVQLTFGSRPAWRLASQPGNDIPTHLVGMLQDLAPACSGWVPGSDRF